MKGSTEHLPGMQEALDLIPSTRKKEKGREAGLEGGRKKGKERMRKEGKKEGRGNKKNTKEITAVWKEGRWLDASLQEDLALA